MQAIEKLHVTEIIDRILKGEKALYEIIVRRYNPCLYKVGRAYNYNHDDTQDLMQDTYIDAYKSLSQYEGRADFKTWIIRIMLNNCYRKKEKSSFKNEIMKDTPEHSQPAFTTRSNDTDKIYQNRELGRVIETALEKIPLDYRLVFTMRNINGLNVAETAAVLNISESNVKVRLNRAKTMLKKQIEKTYSPDEIFEFNLVYCDAMVDRVMKIIKETEI